MSYENKILTAIDIMINKAIENLDYDKTIVGVIHSIVDPVLGEYRVRYQDSIFTAYNENGSGSYKKGDSVYVMMPSNDINKNRIILGLTNKTSETLATTLSNEDKYVYIGNNVINYGSTIKLNSFKNYDEKRFNQEQLGVLEDDIKMYRDEANYIVIAGRFKTSLPREQQVGNGNYGVVVEARFFNKDAGVEYTRPYVLDVNNMIGQPYKSYQPTRQYVVFPIEGSDFVGIDKLIAFSQNFPKQDESKAADENYYDIEVSELEFYFAREMTEEELNGISLKLITPQGGYFKVGETYKAIEALVKQNGVTLKNVSNVEYYWFIQDLTIESDSKGYSPLAGTGWKCLNDTTEDSEAIDGNVEYISGGDEFELTNENCPFYENIFKCIAVVSDINVGCNITIVNKNHQGNIVSIKCSEDNSFPFKSTPSITLTGYLGDNVIDGNEYSCVWAAAADGGLTQTLEGSAPTLVTNPNAAEKMIVYYLTVKHNDTTVGMASLTLTNAMSTAAYNLFLNDADILFKYNTEGVSPTSKQVDKKDRLVLRPITFTLYDKSGRDVAETAAEKINRLSIKWYWPTSGSMISAIDLTPEGTEVIDGIEYNYFEAKNESHTQFNYSINSRYNINYTNNTIILKVKAKGVESVAYSAFAFVKDGEQGTNGTKYVTQIVPSADKDYVVFGHNKKIYYYDVATKEINYLSSFPFVLKIWNQGEVTILDSNKSYWEMIPRNKANFTITNGDLVCKDIIDMNNASIIQAYAVQPDGKKCYCSYRIPLVNSSSSTESYIIYGGFDYAVYSATGENVQYDTSYPFEVRKIDLNSGEVSNPISASWEVSWDSSQNRTGDIFRATPPKKLRSDSNNFIKVTVNGVVVNYPVHFYINRYSMAAMNDWDGNGIDIGEEKILAPQIAAGKKENDNSFTGVAIGETFQNNNSSEIGLFGYASGERTIFLNANNGNFIFGKSSGNYISFDNGNLTANVNSISIQGSDVKNSIDDAAKTATNYLTYNSSGLYIHRPGSYNSGYNTQITSDGINFRNGTTVLNKIDGTGMYLYDASTNDVIAKFGKSSSGADSEIGLGANFFYTGKFNFYVGSYQVRYGEMFRMEWGMSSAGTFLTLGGLESSTQVSHIAIDCNHFSVLATDTVFSGMVSFSSISISGNITSKVKITGGDLQVYNYNNIICKGTTNNSITGGDDMSIESDGTYGVKASSSKRYKNHISSIKKDDLDPSALLNLPVVQFKYNKDYLKESDQRYNKLVPGFIAEDVAEIYPIACQYKDNKPEDWNARYIIPPMLALIQDQEKRIIELENFIKDLKGDN